VNEFAKCLCVNVHLPRILDTYDRMAIYYNILMAFWLATNFLATVSGFFGGIGLNRETELIVLSRPPLDSDGHQLADNRYTYRNSCDRSTTARPSNLVGVLYLSRNDG